MQTHREHPSRKVARAKNSTQWNSSHDGFLHCIHRITLNIGDTVAGNRANLFGFRSKLYRTLDAKKIYLLRCTSIVLSWIVYVKWRQWKILYRKAKLMTFAFQIQSNSDYFRITLSCLFYRYRCTNFVIENYFWFIHK